MKKKQQPKQEKTTFQTTSTVFLGHSEPRTTDAYEEWQLFTYDRNTGWTFDETFDNQKRAIEMAEDYARQSVLSAIISIKIPQVKIPY